MFLDIQPLTFDFQLAGNPHSVSGRRGGNPSKNRNHYNSILVGKNYRDKRNTSANFRTGTALQKNHSCTKFRRACDLAALVCDMLLKEVREEHMEGELFYKTAFCTEYERLLCVCVQSLDTWKNCREEIANSALRRWEAGDELTRSQADYAKAYSRLEKHMDNCELCHFVSKINGRNNASLSTAVMDKKHSA
ncbi:MAG TPA: hypothetical protein VNY24_13290 [Candidatus Acidoferrales bacterium]|nr:hypothetical protein [Candidatus Acidoferrales bacterium]